MDITLVSKLQQRFTKPLPGLDAQLKMAPSTRRFFYDIPVDAVPAGVLVLLFPKNKKWHIALIERNTHHKDKHSGQISFPGGKIEQGDESYAAGALREMEEEVGVKRGDVQLLGALTPLFIYVSNFAVYPFLAVLDVEPQFNPQVEEVQRILEIPIDELLSPDAVKMKDMKVRPNITLNRVPYYDLSGQIVWGATAMILSELSELLNSL